VLLTKISGFGVDPDCMLRFQLHSDARWSSIEDWLPRGGMSRARAGTWRIRDESEANIGYFADVGSLYRQGSPASKTTEFKPYGRLTPTTPTVVDTSSDTPVGF
jgi:hypothetical protein